MGVVGRGERTELHMLEWVGKGLKLKCGSLHCYINNLMLILRVFSTH